MAPLPHLPDYNVERARRMLGMLYFLIPQTELCQRMGMTQPTLMRFLSDPHYVPRMGVNPHQVLNVYKRWLDRQVFAHRSKALRISINAFSQFMDPKTVKVNRLGRITGNATFVAVRDYINNAGVRGEKVSQMDAAAYFARPEFFREFGYSIPDATVRAAFRRVLAQFPELVEHTYKAAPGRKFGSKLVYGDGKRGAKKGPHVIKA